MYDLMEKTDTLVRRMIGTSGFLLWLYETYVPTRAWIMSEICAILKISSQLWKTAISQNFKTLKNKNTKRKQAVSFINFQISNILKTTIGASANYFNAVFQSNIFQYTISF